eukprot:5517961-Ditylum_brightwellii.AAC.1
MMIRRDTLLMNSSLSPGMIDEIMYLKMWYMQWRKAGDRDILIEEVFTEELWSDFVIRTNGEEREEAKALKKEAELQEELPCFVQVKDPVKETSSGGLNVSYKEAFRQLALVVLCQNVPGQAGRNVSGGLYYAQEE